MKRRILTLFLSTVMIFSLALSLTACGDDGGQEQTTSDEDGYAPTEGLQYSEINESGNVVAYSVSGIGTATDKKIFIPSKYSGKPVTAISQSAFESCSSITGVTIGNNVTDIGKKAFYDCSNLNSITFGESVTSLGTDAFSLCTSLSRISVAAGNSKYHNSGNCLIETESKTLILGCKSSRIPSDGSVTSIGRYAFFWSTDLTSITIPESITVIREYAFCVCTGLTNITIPEGLTTIEEGAFDGAKELVNITIPVSVKNIGRTVFRGCYSFKHISYNGTKAQWEDIDKDYRWDQYTGRFTIRCTDEDISKI